MAKSEHRQLVEGPAGALEVAWREAAGGPLSGRGYCAVVCHPHPQHGGTMDNKVVTTLVRLYHELGVPVARFNFRGVGASEGRYGEGVGEVADLGAVAEWFRSEQAAEAVLLAGFSFGSGVVSNACHSLSGVVHATFVAPPVQRYNFSSADRYPCPVCVVIAGEDELIDAAEIDAWADALRSVVDIVRIDQASHFFHGQLVTLRNELGGVLGRRL